uniref:Ovule protein n=1 Tax=Ascaris lumbricoides TaxID=6252 RepID=A0A0M3ITF7_ASCLU
MARSSEEESVSYCEHLVECESSSRMQERICTGNTILMPYWLPSSNQQKQMCYHLLRNDYIMVFFCIFDYQAMLLYAIFVCICAPD